MSGDELVDIELVRAGDAITIREGESFVVPVTGTYEIKMPPDFDGADLVYDPVFFFSRMPASVWLHHGRHGRQWRRLDPLGADRLDPYRLPAWMGWLE